MSEHDLVLVVDFGAQYAQLIARRVREANVYSEIVPHTMPVAEMLARKPQAIVLLGGPSSVYEEGAPALDGALFEGGVPVFGMCYGFQIMAQALGGKVSPTGAREYGRTPVSVVEAGTLLALIPTAHNVWMSHGDSVTEAPVRFHRAGVDPRARRSRPSRTSGAASLASSGTPRCCTPSTASRCSSTSSSTSPAAGRPGLAFRVSIMRFTYDAAPWAGSCSAPVGVPRCAAEVERLGAPRCVPHLRRSGQGDRRGARRHARCTRRRPLGRGCATRPGRARRSRPCPRSLMLVLTWSWRWVEARRPGWPRRSR